MAKHLTTCPACGAANSADSEWCGQCYTSLLTPVEEPPVAAVPTAAATTTTSTSGVPGDAGDGDEVDDPRWTCKFCGALNPVVASNCTQCFRSIFDSFGAEAERPKLDPQEALRHSAFFPGLGLIRLGWSAHGIAIAAVVLFALGGAFFLIPTGEVVAGVVLFVMAAGIWAAAARDAGAIAAGRPGAIWLTPQALLVTAVVVFVVAGLAFAQALGEARSSL